jgi:hypothetical protein
VGDFKLDEVARDDADDFTAPGQRGIGHRTHQTDTGTTIDEANA